MTEGVVRAVMACEGLRSVRSVAARDSPPLGPDEWLVGQLTAKLRVTHGVIHQWIKAGRVKARQRDDRRWVVTADEATCRDLVANRERRHRRRLDYETGGALGRSRGKDALNG